MNRRGFMQTLFGGVVAGILPWKAKPPLQTKPLSSLPKETQKELLSKVTKPLGWSKTVTQQSGQITTHYFTEGHQNCRCYSTIDEEIDLANYSSVRVISSLDGTISYTIVCT